MYETESPRLNRIDWLLKSKSYEALEMLTIEEVPNGLLTEQTLDAARWLQLPATVIYVASLATENLDNTATCQKWLAIYQSIGRTAQTSDFQKISEKSPLRWAAISIMGGGSADKAVLKKCQASAEEWRHAIELAIDHLRFDVLVQLVAEMATRKNHIAEWLNAAKTLLSRYPSPEKSNELGPLGNAYALIREQLKSPLTSVVSVRSKMALFASHCHMRAGNFQLAIKHAHHASAPADRSSSAMNIAKAYCHAGDFPATIDWLGKLIASLTDKETHQVASPKKDEEGQAPKKKPAKFDPDAAGKALLDLQGVLEAHGKRAFLVAGTLLGYAREGQILAHDKDIDVGIIGWEDQFEIANALIQSGMFTITFRHLGGRGSHHFAINHLGSGICIDIFIYHEENGKLVTGIVHDFGYLQQCAFTPFEPKSVKFLGIDFYVPSDVELNLAENFGNWRQSDPGYISHLESPSLLDVGGLVYQVVGNLKAVEALMGKNIDKLTRVIQIMETYQHRPGGMREETLDLLRKAKAEFSAISAKETVPC